MSGGGTQIVNHDLGYEFVLSEDGMAALVNGKIGSPSLTFPDEFQQTGLDLGAALALTDTWSHDLNRVRLFAFTRDRKYDNVKSPYLGEQLPYIIVEFDTGEQQNQLPLKTLVASNEEYLKENDGAKILSSKWPGNPNGIDVGSFTALESLEQFSLTVGSAMFFVRDSLVSVTLTSDSQFWDGLSPSMGEIISTLKLLP